MRYGSGQHGLAVLARRSNKIIAVVISTIVCAFCIASEPSNADAVKLEGFWIRDVIVDQITDTEVLYVSSTGSEVSRPIEALQGLQLESYPELEQGEQLVEQGDLAGAKKLFEKVRNRASQKWVQQRGSYLLLAVYDGLGEPIRLVDEVIRLAKGKAPVLYLEGFPIESIEASDQKVRDEVVGRLETAGKLLGQRPEGKVIAATLEQVKALKPAVDKVSQGQEASPDNTSETETPEQVTIQTIADGPSTSDTKPAAENGSSNSDGLGLTLPATIDRADQATRFLASGEIRLALKAADIALRKGEGQVAMRLYQKGMAEFALAEADGDPALYLDAGLSFMRVVVNYPTSVYAAPSLVELGAVHTKIGRLDKAKQLFQTASETLDREEEPSYTQRLERLRTSVNR